MCREIYLCILHLFFQIRPDIAVPQQGITLKTNPERQKADTYIKISLHDEQLNFDSMATNCCNLDPKVTLFGTFQVGWTTVDVGSDSFQVYDYYIRKHYK